MKTQPGTAVLWLLPLGVLLLIAVVAAIAAGVLLATRPWSDGTVAEEAAASPSEYGLCNVSVSNIPPDVSVAPFSFFPPEGSQWQPAKSGRVIFVFLYIPLPPGQRPVISPDMSKDKPVQSNAVINAETGQVVAEGYLTPADEAKIKAVLATLRVGPWEPAGPAWPRTDTAPRGKVVEFPKVVETLADYGKPTLKYREPEAGSGMLAGRIGQRLEAFTCASKLVLDAETGQVLDREVIAEEDAMFQRFLGEVVTP